MRVFGLVGAAVVVAACGGGSDGGPSGQTPVASVTVVPSATTTSICGTVTLTATPRDAQGNALSRNVDNWSGGGSILDLSGLTGATVTGTGVGVGTANITATAGGQTSTAVPIAVTATGTAPATQTVAATTGNAFSPGCVELAPGGSVTWTFASEHNVQFQGSQPTGGNIDRTSTGSVSRTFPNAGNYEYTCTLHAGMNGRVVVR